MHKVTEPFNKPPTTRDIKNMVNVSALNHTRYAANVPHCNETTALKTGKTIYEAVFVFEIAQQQQILDLYTWLTTERNIKTM